MNYEQAKEVLNGDFTQVVLKDNESHSDVFSEAFHMAIEALEKQIPKKPKKLTYEPLIKGGWTYECPHCGLAIGENRFADYEYSEPTEPFCGQCGQAIDWSEVE